MFKRTFRIIHKELIQMRRDPALIRMLILAPVLQLFIYGYVVATEIRSLRMVVLDYSESPESRRLIDRFVASGYFVVHEYARRPDEITDALNSGAATVGIVIPARYAENVGRGSTAVVQMIIDGTNSNTAVLTLGYAGGVIASESNDLMETNFQKKGFRLIEVGIQQEERVWFNPSLRSINYLVPGIICALLLEMMVPMTALSIVKERERGTIEQLMVTPVRAIEVLVGKTVPYVFAGFLDAVLIVLIGMFWFRVPIVGNLALLLAYSSLFVVVGLGMGILIATLVRTQQQVALSAQVAIIPNILLSGFMFPIDSMPEIMQWFTTILPMRYFLVIVRGIMMKGLGPNDLWGQTIPLAILGAIVFSISWYRFRKVFG